MKLEDQELLFGIFHDGSIFEVMEQEKDYLFRVDILYLAERVKPDFRSFNIQIVQPEEFFFEDSEMNNIIGDLDEINKLELEILKTDTKEDKIKVFCSADNGNMFGFLNIKTKDIRIYDQEHNQLELKELEKIAREYWDEFGKRAKK